jgi:hypothetical protein
MFFSTLCVFNLMSCICCKQNNGGGTTMNCLGPFLLEIGHHFDCGIWMKIMISSVSMDIVSNGGLLEELVAACKDDAMVRCDCCDLCIF